MTTIRGCLEAACEAADVDIEEVLGERRQRRVARVRQLTCFLARDLLGTKSWRQIATVMNRDHSTVIHAFHRADKLLETDGTFRDLYMRALGKLAVKAS